MSGEKATNVTLHVQDFPNQRRIQINTKDYCLKANTGFGMEFARPRCETYTRVWNIDYNHETKGPYRH